MTTQQQQDHEVRVKAERAASYRVTWGLDGTETDLAIAEAITDYLLAAALLRRPTICLGIIHDARARPAEYSERKGLCPLPFDWRRKNSVGIKTTDREVARDWCMKALLLGYGVFQCRSPLGIGGGMGTIAEHRERQRERFHDSPNAARIKAALVDDPLLLKRYPDAA